MTWSEGNSPITAFGIAPQQQECRQSNRRRCIPPDRFRQNLGRISRGNCFTISARRSSLVMTQKRRSGRQRQQPRHRLLDHGALAIEREQLLRASPSAERPEPRSPASSKNHGIEIDFVGHGVYENEILRLPSANANPEMRNYILVAGSGREFPGT